MKRRLIIAAVLALSACIYTYRHEETGTRTWGAAGVERIVASTLNGRIDFVAGNDTLIVGTLTRYAYGRNRSDAEKAIANVTIIDSIVGPDLRVEARMPSAGVRPYGAFFTFTAPRSTAVDFETTNGSIAVTGAGAGVRAGTTNGDITLTGTEGAATVATTNGKVTLAGHRGSVTSATTNGTIRCDIAALDAAENATLSTTNSDIELFLPADVSATITAGNTTGTIRFLDFDYTYPTMPTDHHVVGRIGSGTSTITIQTTNGDITVRRR